MIDFDNPILRKRSVTPFSRPYDIAEIGVNHEGSLDHARRLIDLAKQGEFPYLQSPYAKPVTDHLKIIKSALLRCPPKFTFWHNMMNVVAYKSEL
jgi:hypothetical protein